MPSILEHRCDETSSSDAILAAVLTIAMDRHHRVLVRDELDWMNTKMREVARLVGILSMRDRETQSDGPST